MIRIKRATLLTIFSTTLMIFIMLTLYFFILSELDAQVSPVHLIILIPMIIFSYIASALVIDQTLNPIRLMITKVRAVGNMDFSTPLKIDDSDDELREYVIAFNEMSQKLNRYIELQKRFISDASHELATPLAVINGHADMLSRRKESHPEILDNSLGIIRSEALRMDELVNSLLQLARSDNGKELYSIERINLSNLTAESINEARLVAPEFTFNEEIESEIWISCDDYAIRRVMRIILTNAIKYSGKNRVVSITATTDNEHAHIKIEDCGIGIPEQHMKNIFDRFYRVDPSRSKKTGSSGLGLAIAKEIVSAHNGTILVESEPDKGSAFEVVLPISSSNLH